jgi:DNA-binding IclR family transcriptional regulator
MSDQTAIHAILSNPDKYAIMDYLASAARPSSVTDVANGVGISQTWASKCLFDLARVGLVDRKREDQTVWNSLSPRAVWPIVIFR